MAEKLLVVKAVGDWELDVRGIPFGSMDDKDKDGEFFDNRTNRHEDKFPLPPAVYYHGYDDNRQRAHTPEYIGKTVSAETRDDGVWYRVVLDKASQFAQRVWEAAKEGLARASSGSIEHLARVDGNGHIREWPVAELSIFEIGEGKQPAHIGALAIPVMKAIYKQADIDWPDEFDETEDPKDGARGGGDKEGKQTPIINTEVIKMTDKTEAQIKEEARNELLAEQKVKTEAKAAEQARVADAVKAALAAKAKEDEVAAEAAKVVADEAAKKAAEERRLIGVPPVFNKLSGDIAKFDNIDASDAAVLIQVLKSAGKNVSDSAYKALAVKMGTDKTDVGMQGTRFLKSRGAIKDDEIQYSTLSGFGDEWVGVAYSNALWQSIRADSKIVSKIPSMEVPAGHESVTIPLQGADPTFYKVAQVEDFQATDLVPVPTVTASQMATSNTSLTLSKMGARVMWSGELEEDSLVPFVNQLRRQLSDAGIEQLEHAVIDGDNDLTASTNINDIAGTPAATDLFTLFDGFREVALTNNSRDGGALTAEDYLETAWLMGTAGMGGADISKVAFIVDPNVYKKSLELSEVKTRDVFVAPTLEQGQLSGIYGYDLFPSWQMHYKSTTRKANSAGKVDQNVVGNNTKGAILAVRWDQWLLGYRRRMTMETTRIANADATEIVALARMGLINRDTAASAISYNITI